MASRRWSNMTNQAFVTKDTLPKDLNRTVKPALKRHRRVPLPEIGESLKKVLAQLLANPKIKFTAKTKSFKGNRRILANKRSKYIGVSGNKTHWQALINVGIRKRYIGTYLSEKEAAIMFDIYSIGLHGTTASVNFDYTSNIVASMIEEFLMNGTLNPLPYACQV